MTEYEHEGLARALARPYAWAGRRGSQGHEDLLQEARIAVWEAERAYDPTRGYAFSTYARYVARSRMHRCADTMSQVMRLPRGQSLKVWLGQGRFPGMASELELEQLGETDESDPMARLAIEAFEALPERLRSVLAARLFEDRTLESIGSEMGVCRERARQLEERALDMIRRSMRAGMATRRLR